MALGTCAIYWYRAMTIKPIFVRLINNCIFSLRLDPPDKHDELCPTGTTQLCLQTKAPLDRNIYPMTTRLDVVSCDVSVVGDSLLGDEISEKKRVAIMQIHRWNTCTLATVVYISSGVVWRVLLIIIWLMCFVQWEVSFAQLIYYIFLSIADRRWLRGN